MFTHEHAKNILSVTILKSLSLTALLFINRSKNSTMKKAVIILSLMFFIGFANAQDKTTKHPCFRVSSFSASFGVPGAVTSNTNSDYYNLKGAVEDPSLFVDITDYSRQDHDWISDGMYYGPQGMSYYGTFSGSMTANLGLTPYSKKLGKFHDNREMRVTLGINMGTRNSFKYYQNNTFVIDTFQSVHGNGIVYADSSIYTNYYYELVFNEVNFGLSYLFKTDVNRRVHFYAGAGFNYGITLKSTVNAHEYIDKSVYYYDQYNKPSEDEVGFYGNIDNHGYTDKFSDTKLKNPIQFVRVYVPFGLSLRLSKKPESFFNHVDLYTEFDPGVEFQIMGSATSYVNPYFGFAFIGFNYHW
jgi:hypothetical protein